MSDDEKTAQAKRDEERRHLHFQVRLDPVLAKNVQHYADQNHGGVRNAAVKTTATSGANAVAMAEQRGR